MATVLLIGTLDTKGPETAFLRDRIQELGCNTLVLDSGILGEAVGIKADFDRRIVAEKAGSTIDALRNSGSRGKAVEEMCKGVRHIALDLFSKGQIQGVISLGGAEGAVLAASAMKVLPVGFPKLIVSPLASGHRKFAPFVGTTDVTVMHSVVDILGLNAVSCPIFENAAYAMAGMAMGYAKRTTTDTHRPSIAATMLGNTTRPLMHIRPRFEPMNMDFVIFHANGVGGMAMEELIERGYFAGVLDYTLSEVAGTIAGGYHNGGATRMETAARVGIPQVVVPGCLDFVVFGAKHEVPEAYNGRPVYYHNPEFTLVRLTHDEQLRATQFVVDKLNQATGAVTVVVPLRGASVMDIEGGAFWQPDWNAECRAILKNGLKTAIRYREIDAHINDATFAEATFDELKQLL